VDDLSKCVAPIKNSRNIRWDRIEYTEKVATLERLFCMTAIKKVSLIPTVDIQ
jgi:hypothetical protein